MSRGKDADREENVFSCAVPRPIIGNEEDHCEGEFIGQVNVTRSLTSAMTSFAILRTVGEGYLGGQKTCSWIRVKRREWPCILYSYYLTCFCRFRPVIVLSSSLLSFLSRSSSFRKRILLLVGVKVVLERGVGISDPQGLPDRGKTKPLSSPSRNILPNPSFNPSLNPNPSLDAVPQ